MAGIIPFQGGWICGRCGKWYESFYACSAHYGKCRGLGYKGDIMGLADDLVWRGDSGVLKGLVALGLVILLGLAFEKSLKNREEQEKHRKNLDKLRQQKPYLYKKRRRRR